MERTFTAALALALGLLGLLGAWTAPARALDVPRAPRDRSGRAVRRLVEEGFASVHLSDRLAARKALVRLGPAAGAHLVRHLGDRRYRVRLWTLLTLGDLSYHPALPRIFEQVREGPDAEDLEFQRAVARTLVRMGRDRPEALRRAAQGLSGRPRELARQALGSLALGDVIAYMAPFIDDQGSSGSYQGQFEGLRSMGEPGVLALLEIVNLGEGQVPEPFFPEAFREKARQETWVDTLKWLSILALGELGNPVALPALEKAFEEYLREGDYYLSRTRACAYACWRMGRTGPMERFLTMLQERSGRMSRRSVNERIHHHFDLGYTYNMVNRTRDALREYRTCVLLHRSFPTESDGVGLVAQYNIACLHSMAGEVEEGLEALATAVDLGYDDHRWMVLDGDLDRVMQDPRFQLLLARLFLRKARGLDENENYRILHIEDAMEHARAAAEEGLLPREWPRTDPLFGQLHGHDEYPLLLLRLALNALHRWARAPFRF